VLREEGLERPTIILASKGGREGLAEARGIRVLEQLLKGSIAVVGLVGKDLATGTSERGLACCVTSTMYCPCLLVFGSYFSKTVPPISYLVTWLPLKVKDST
jgi:hypothetical protein